jgi:hypothetical protein
VIDDRSRRALLAELDELVRLHPSLVVPPEHLVDAVATHQLRVDAIVSSLEHVDQDPAPPDGE